MLNIALLGACPVQLAELAAALEQTAQALGAQITLVTADNADALPAGLSGFALVLLAGLEAPERPDSPCPAPCKEELDAACDQERVDRSIRAALVRDAVSFRVLYGPAGERLAHARQAVQSLLPAAGRPAQVTRTAGLKNQPWVWMCDKCSDPRCEHRLLTALLAIRDSAAPNAGEQPRPLLNR